MGKYKPLRPCIERGCPKLTTGTRCVDHAPDKNNLSRSPSSVVTSTHAHRKARAAMVAKLPLPCHICGKPILTADDLHADHVNPLVLGGGDTIKPAHAFCNMSKKDRVVRRR